VGFLDRLAMRSVQKRFSSQLEPGETLLGYDVGRAPAGQVSLVVTDRGVIVIGNTIRTGMRIGFDSLHSISTDHKNVVELESNSGTPLRLTFDRPRQPFVGNVIVESLEAWRQQKRR
jgi:hypothetical protein